MAPMQPQTSPSQVCVRRHGLEAVLKAPISKASAAQRAGRAGRVRAGHCFRLCTEAEFEASLPESTVRPAPQCGWWQMMQQCAAGMGAEVCGGAALWQAFD